MSSAIDAVQNAVRAVRFMASGWETEGAGPPDLRFDESAPGAAHRQTQSVARFGLEVSAIVALEGADVVEIHDVRAMYAQEALRVESLLERFSPRANSNR